jgi:hypothetical protein
MNVCADAQQADAFFTMSVVGAAIDVITGSGFAINMTGGGLSVGLGFKSDEQMHEWMSLLVESGAQPPLSTTSSELTSTTLTRTDSSTLEASVGNGDDIAHVVAASIGLLKKTKDGQWKIKRRYVVLDDRGHLTMKNSDSVGDTSVFFDFDGMCHVSRLFHVLICFS